MHKGVSAIAERTKSSNRETETCYKKAYIMPQRSKYSGMAQESKGYVWTRCSWFQVRLGEPYRMENVRSKIDNSRNPRLLDLFVCCFFSPFLFCWVY